MCTSWITEGETGSGELLKDGVGEVKAAGIRVEASEREGELLGAFWK